MSRTRTPSFARTGATSPYGKLDDWIERIRIEGFIKDEFVRKTTAAGKPSGEVVRDFARVVVLGPDEARRMYGESVLVSVRLIGGMSDKQ